MTATETLRRMLDERGVEHEDSELIDHSDGTMTCYTEWGGNDDGDGANVYVEYTDGTVLRMFDATPEQAIAATLGGGECEDEGGIGANGEQAFNCSECGCVLSLYDSDGANTLCTGFVHDYPRFCPACGRSVKR